MNSSDWIAHFYRNACEARQPLPSGFGEADVRSLQAVRPGRLSLRSGQPLIEKSRQVAEQSGDLSFAWAVRLYVREQENQNRLLNGLAALGEPVARDDWRGSIIDAMPADLVVLLLGCRARVAASFFAAMADRATGPAMRTFYMALEQKELGQLHFAAFAGTKMLSEGRQVPVILIEALSRAVTVGIATRVWLRQRTRLRESGHTFAGFVSALLQPGT